MSEEVQIEEVTVETSQEETQPEIQEVKLPSDEVEIVVPDKFKDKSKEDIIKAYVELERMKKGGDSEISQEGEEPSKEPEEKSAEEIAYEKYEKSLEENGALSEAEYEELAKAGYDKATVDAEIQRRQEQKEFENWKREKALSDVLEPLGGGTEKFKEVAEWAAKSKTPEEVQAFNEALAAAPKLAQQALLKELYAEYDSAGTSDTVLHTNTPQMSPSRGYASEADFFKDISAPEYTSQKSFAKAVEKKLAQTDTTGWSIG